MDSGGRIERGSYVGYGSYIYIYIGDELYIHGVFDWKVEGV